MVSGGSIETNVPNLWRWRAVRTCLGSLAKFICDGVFMEKGNFFKGM